MTSPSAQDLLARLELAVARLEGSATSEDVRAALEASTVTLSGSSSEEASARALLARIANGVVGRLDATAASKREREVLLAGVCHDLRNPLNTFAMSTSLLRGDLERQGPPAQHGLSLLDRIDRGQARMRSIVEDLSEASRIDAGKVELALSAASPKELVEAATGAAEALLGEKRITLTVEPVEGAPRLPVDRARVLDLFARVFAYGVRVTGEGGALALRVRASPSDVTFAFRARFPGSVVPAVDRQSGGLGFVIARGVAALHGGSFDVDVDPGEGEEAASLRIVVTLPIVAAPATDAAPRTNTP